jgi:hypothetical protein
VSGGGRSRSVRFARALAFPSTLACRSTRVLPSALGLGLLVACSGSLPPLRGQIEVGREAYAILVAGADAASGDLYAVRAAGGPAIPITFSSVGEMRPALSPNGERVAFLRSQAVGDTTPGSVWVMNLQSGAEHEVELPRRAGVPRRVGWSSDGISLTVAAGAGLYRARDAGSAKAEPVSAAERAAAESSLAVLLGNPVFARVVPCPTGALCVATGQGPPGLLAEGARDAARWGDDSVAFFLGNSIEVRPLGPGRVRRLEWSGVAGKARELTVFAGRAEPGNDGTAR